MKKITYLIGGIVLGIIISYFTLDYTGWIFYEMDDKGNTAKTSNELDFDLLTNSFLIILACTLLIYIAGTLIDKYRKKICSNNCLTGSIKRAGLADDLKGEF